MEATFTFLYNIGAQIIRLLKKSFEKLVYFINIIITEKDKLLDPIVKKYWPDLSKPKNIKKHWLITPDALCYYRIIIGIIFLIMLFPSVWLESLAILLAIIGWLTDLFDGVVARVFNLFSKYGSILDPLADKMLHLPLFLHYFNEEPYWLSAMFMSEVSLIFLRRFKQLSDVKANYFGKAKMGAQFLSLLTKILHIESIAYFLFIIAVILGFCSLTKQVMDSTLPEKFSKPFKFLKRFAPLLPFF